MNGRRMLIDTAFVLSLLNRADEHHVRACAWLPLTRDAAELWITEAILVEVGNACSAFNRPAAVRFIRDVYQTPNVRVVSIDADLLQRSVQLYEQRPDKQWGLTDCISFVVMQDQGLVEALTPDHHFEQAGLVALLRTLPT